MKTKANSNIFLRLLNYAIFLFYFIVVLSFACETDVDLPNLDLSEINSDNNQEQIKYNSLFDNPWEVTELTSLIILLICDVGIMIYEKRIVKFTNL